MISFENRKEDVSMSPTIGRFRERIAPSSSGQPTKAGSFYQINGTTGARSLLGDLFLIVSPAATSIERTWDQINPGPPYRSGGDFVSVKAQLPQNGLVGIGTYRGYKYGTGTVEYQGGFGDPWVFDSIPNSDYLNYGFNQDNTNLFPPLDSYSSQVYDRLRPRLESAGIYVAIAEAKDVPRMLQTSSRVFRDTWRTMRGSMSASRIMQPRRVADNFLNHQFGWIPFIKDLSNLYSTYSRALILKEQIARDNNKWIKRKRAMKDVQSEEIVFDSRVNGGGAFRVSPNIPWILSTGGGHYYQIVLQTSSVIWCEGSFKYYRPEFDTGMSDFNSTWNSINRDLMIYGLRVSPQHIYQATPWTWLADWFTNAGSVVQRANDWGLDSMAARYMYLMRHQLRTVVLRQFVRFYDGTSKTLEWHRVLESKQRMGASSPYGLGLSWESLSARQLGILVSLGITRTT
jgi:hypothetical protein